MFKAYFNDMVGEIPDYIFTMPSSTSGKYHNATQCEKFGQVYHEYMFSSVLNHRLRLKGNREKYNTPEIRDCMRCVPVFHDAIKCGWNGSLHTVHEHPMLAAEWVRNTKVENDIPNEYKEMIADMCEAHSGEWHKAQAHALARHHLRKPDRRLPAQEAPVIANAETLVLHAFALHAPRHSAGHAPDIRLGKFIADNRSPSARTESDHMYLLPG